MPNIQLVLVDEEYNPAVSGDLAIMIDRVIHNTYRRTELPKDIKLIKRLLEDAFALGVEFVNGSKDFMIGQRVIYSDVICTVCMPEDSKISFDPNNPHIMNPEKGYIHWASKDNLKPLPNGQL